MTVRNPSSRWRDILLGIVCIGFVVGAVAVVILQNRVSDAKRTASSAQDRAVSAGSAAAANQAALRSANACITKNCGTPVPTPSPVPGPVGERGPGATNLQVRAAVLTVCSTYSTLCQTPVSLASLKTAVQACFATDECPAPKPGRAGPSGASGRPGRDAPAVTQDQLVASFAAYCAQQADNCRGVAGPTGPAGADGKDGASGAPGQDAPRITAIDCTGPPPTDGMTFTYHFSNGVDITVTCSAAKPTPTPSGAPPS